MHTSTQSNLVQAIIAHCATESAEAARFLTYMALNANDNGQTTFTGRDLLHYTPTQNVSTSHRTYRNLLKVGHIKELARTTPGLAQQRTQILPANLLLTNYTIQFTITCNDLCSATNHCPDGTYQNILRLGQWTPRQLAANLDALPGELADAYRHLLITLSSSKDTIAFSHSFIHEDALTSTHPHLQELAHRGYITLAPITRSVDPTSTYYSPQPVLGQTHA